MNNIINSPILCKHCSNKYKYKGKGLFWVCSAFPKGIPSKILINEIEHNEIIPEQDNNIIFKPF